MIVNAYHFLLDRIPLAWRAAGAVLAEAVAKAAVQGDPVSPEALRRIHDTMAKARAWASLQAGQQTHNAVTMRAQFAAPRRLDVSTFYSLPFDEAILAWIMRHPDVLIDPDDLLELYWERGATVVELALVQTQSLVDRAIAKALTDGVPLRNWRAVMAATQGETEAYWETVYRTNVAQAYSDGQRMQAKALPDVIGFRRVTTRDNVTRPNHRAAHGLVYAKDHWNADWFAAPFGFNCRCTDVPVTRAMARRAGIEFTDNGDPILPDWPAEARPDLGFK